MYVIGWGCIARLLVCVTYHCTTMLPCVVCSFGNPLLCLFLDSSHRSQDASEKYPTMQHFVTEMCTHVCAHFCDKMLHCGIWDKCIWGFVRVVYGRAWLPWHHHLNAVHCRCMHGPWVDILNIAILLLWGFPAEIFIFHFADLKIYISDNIWLNTHYDDMVVFKILHLRSVFISKCSFTCVFNSSPPSATYKHQWIAAALVQRFACSAPSHYLN